MEAVKMTKEKMERHPQTIQIVYELGLIYRNAGDHVLELEAFKRAAAMDSGGPKTNPRYKAKAFNQLGVLAFDSGDATTAKDFFLKALENDPSSKIARKNLAALEKKK